MIDHLKPYPAYKDSGVPWLGKIPVHWDVRRQRNLVQMLVSNIDKHTTDSELRVRLCNYSDVYKNERITESLRFMHASATPEEVKRFRLQTGDVIITKDSEAWNDIGVPALVEYTAPDLVCGYHLAILRPRENVLLGAYLLRVLQSHGAAAQFHVSATGVTRFGLSHNAIKNVFIPLPPLDEQAAIVRFLDHANRRIDRYIRAKRKLIALLNEQKQAIIHQAVTRGLSPNVRLKPSGVEWLGDIPAHWEVKRIKYLLREVDHRSTTGQETLLSLRMNHGLVPHDEHFLRPGQASTLVGYKLVRPGQVVLNRLQANNGLVFASDVFGVVSPDYAVFDPVADVNLQYLTALFRTPKMKHKFRIESKGLGTGTAGFLRLYTDRFGMIAVPLPPRDEQSQIMNELDTSLSGIQNTSDRVQREIDLLREYHTRLVADVVTGQLDVRAAASLPAIAGEEVERMEDWLAEDDEMTESEALTEAETDAE